MAGIRDLEKGIKTIQQGQYEEGARLIRIALKDPTLSRSLRATAYIWLAETKTEREEKIRCYQDALNADPGNDHAQKRMSALLELELPPVPATQPNIPLPSEQPPLPITQTQTAQVIPPQPLAQPVNPIPDPVSQPRATGTRPMPAINKLFRTVGIIDGPSGKGSGFFVKPDGLIATTRLVTGGLENVTVELEPGSLMIGRVVRSFPDFDLSFIKVDLQLTSILPATLQMGVTENTDLTVVAHGGQIMKGRCRPTNRAIKPHWFPTTFRKAPDAGGCPIFDDRNQLVGMLTRNSSRVSADLYGLHITVIRNCADLYQQEMLTDPNRVYCPSCGYLSRAASLGAFYCETCGSILPNARLVQRFPVPAANPLYNENLYRACRHCGSRVGYYNGLCLRCGKQA